jgi:protein-disulfide isomerase
MKLPLSVAMAGMVFAASVWMAGALRAESEAAPAASSAQADPLEAKAPPVPREEILRLTDKDVVLGDRKAPVAIFEYSSLSCPHCAHFHKDILPELQKDYINDGKAVLVMRQFPTNKPALEGAMLVRCLSPERGAKFEQVLFEMQDRWVSMDSRAALEKIAAVGGVTEAEFNACLDDKAAEDALLKDLMSARDNLNVEATPTFFIGKEKIDGAREYEVFAKAIDAALNAAPAKAPK